MFARLGGWCYRNRRAVPVLWLVALLLLGAGAGVAGQRSRSQFGLPDVESSRGFDLLGRHFAGAGTGDAANVVFRTERGVTDPEVRAAMEAFFAQVAALPHVDTVRSPYAPGGAQQISSRGQLAGKIAFATIELERGATLEEAASIVDDIKAATPQLPGLQVELGGQVFAEFEPPDSELIGLAFAVVILLVAFGSVLAMGLPIGIALAGIGVGSLLVTLLSHLVTVPDFAPVLGIMIGLGVGIDYALFIVTRFRENLHQGMAVEQATVVAMDTAGRATTFAGITVVISLLGMLVMDLSFVTGLALAAATTVAMTLLASLTLLPALLGFAGQRVEQTRWRGLVAAGFVASALLGVGIGVPALTMACLPLAVVVVLASFAIPALRRDIPRRPPKPVRQTLPYRWSRLVQHHPWIAALGAAALLVVLSVPVLGLRLGFSDEGNFPEHTSTRKAYDLTAEGFGPGFNGVLLLVTEVPDGSAPRLDAVTAAVRATAGVELVTPAIPNRPEAPTAALWRVVPATSPQDAATADLVGRLRDQVLPAATAGSGLDVLVTGSVASLTDFSTYLARRLFWFLGAVLTLSFLLLLVVFRSLLVPLKAVVMNLLSIGAAYGVVVATFQWGWGAGLLDIAGGPIEPFIPMMLFAIVFGLSMDYEVFLLSRVREEYDRTGDSGTSVADGLASTARVITAAAAIMVVVFGSFLLESDRVIKIFGVGLATAVLLDATVVRLLLVPATMELLGDRNWWIPRWLDRVLPRVDVEGTRAEPPGDELPPAPEPQLEPVG